MSVREISRGLGPAFFLGWIAFFSVGADAGEEVNQQRQRELVRLVRNDCGSCHGLKLGGGLGPSLLPAALAGKAPGALRETIQQGRAIATDPEVIFFDEPTAGLDPIMAGVINDLIREIVTEMGATAVTITHDMTTVHSVADEVAMLHDGVIRWQGPVADMEASGDPWLDQFIHGRAEGPIAAVR